MSLSTELRELISAGFGAVWIKTEEPQDASREVFEAAKERGKSPAWAVHRWDCGLGYAAPDGTITAIYDAAMAIENFASSAVPGTRNVLVMKNLHLFLDPQTNNVAPLIQALENQLNTGRAIGQQIVILAPTVRIPLELTRLVALLEHGLPGEAELLDVADKTVTIMPTDPAARAAISRAGRGLARVQMEDAVALSAYRRRAIEPDVIMQVKTDALKKSGLLSIYTGTETFDDLGGLDHLKDFALRSLAPRANRKVRPKGILLTGIPGCGKSHFAKALGNQVGWKTVRLDIRSMMGSFVGQTEERLRNGLAQIDAMDEIIVHIDEVEKSLAGGTSSFQGDSGVAAGILGTLLEWMADRKGKAYIVMTCNDIETLPAPLLRPGRLDGIFFFDYPTPDQRRAIWKIHSEAYGLDAQLIADDTDWTGAEIEGCCNTAALLDINLKAAALKITNVKNTASARMAEMRRLADGRYLSTDHDGLFRDERIRRAEQSNGARRAVSLDDAMTL